MCVGGFLRQIFRLLGLFFFFLLVDFLIRVFLCYLKGDPLLLLLICHSQFWGSICLVFAITGWVRHISCPELCSQLEFQKSAKPKRPLV